MILMNQLGIAGREQQPTCFGRAVPNAQTRHNYVDGALLTRDVLSAFDVGGRAMRCALGGKPGRGELLGQPQAGAAGHRLDLGSATGSAMSTAQALALAGRARPPRASNTSETAA
jgi:hypothetical protein